MKYRIRQYRLERGLTVEQLADRVRLSKSYVSEIENGRKQCNGSRLEAFAAALGVSVHDLIDDQPSQPSMVAHLQIMARLSPEDRAAVERHAASLLRQQGGE